MTSEERRTTRRIVRHLIVMLETWHKEAVHSIATGDELSDRLADYVAQLQEEVKR